MRTHPYIPVVAEEVIELSFAIAFHYIANTRDLEDEEAAQDFIANALARLLQRGERHPIRLANFAISAYEKMERRSAWREAAE